MIRAIHAAPPRQRKPGPRHRTSHRVGLLDLGKREDWRLIVEVGVRLAGTGAFLLEHLPELVYLGVDPYTLPAGTHAEDGFTDYGRPDMDSWYREALRNLHPFLPRGMILKKPSVDAAKSLDPLNADCVFIDGDHREASVLADIDAWRRHVKPGGWLTGHDWSWPSVQRAVTARFPAPLVRAGDVWAVQL